jgi:hypothetical protein
MRDRDVAAAVAWTTIGAAGANNWIQKHGARNGQAVAQGLFTAVTWRIWFRAWFPQLFLYAWQVWLWLTLMAEGTSLRDDLICFTFLLAQTVLTFGAMGIGYNRAVDMGAMNERWLYRQFQGIAWPLRNVSMFWIYALPTLPFWLVAALKFPSFGG